MPWASSHWKFRDRWPHLWVTSDEGRTPLPEFAHQKFPTHCRGAEEKPKINLQRSKRQSSSFGVGTAVNTSEGGAAGKEQKGPPDFVSRDPHLAPSYVTAPDFCQRVQSLTVGRRAPRKGKFFISSFRKREISAASEIAKLWDSFIRARGNFGDSSFLIMQGNNEHQNCKWRREEVMRSSKIIWWNANVAVSSFK